MENLFEVNQTIIKYLRGENLSVHEEVLLQQILADEAGKKLIWLFEDKDWVSRNINKLQAQPEDTVWKKVEAYVESQGTWVGRVIPPVVPIIHTHSGRRWIWKTVVAAALLVILAGGAYTWYQARSGIGPSGQPLPSPVAAAYRPGGNRAVLTLSNGQQINLDSADKRLLINQGISNVSKSADGQLAYNASAAPSGPTLMVYNTLTTPRAGQYSLHLPDGTNVWLNNASSLRYPVYFSGSNREVELTGEAYFEVAKDAMKPFRVLIKNKDAGKDGRIVEVLGTSFNVMAYEDEKTQRTTLVDGSIQLVQGDHKQVLTPAQQAFVDDQGHAGLLKGVNIEEVIAWKNGYFHFDHTDLLATMRQLARWYDVDVEYKIQPAVESFNGKIQRNLPLIDVLKGLENEHIHFRLEGRKLLVLP